MEVLLNILTNKLNKNLIQIINEYVIIDHEKLIQQHLKTRTSLNFYINKDLTIEDIIVKCFQRGYNGFYVYCDLKSIIIYIDSISNQLIESDIRENKKFYRFKNDKRDLYSLELDHLDNVMIKKIIIYNN